MQNKCEEIRFQIQLSASNWIELQQFERTMKSIFSTNVVNSTAIAMNHMYANCGFAAVWLDRLLQIEHISAEEDSNTP